MLDEELFSKREGLHGTLATKREQIAIFLPKHLFGLAAEVDAPLLSLVKREIRELKCFETIISCVRVDRFC